MFAAKNTAAPSGEAVYIESVFSTYLYTGTGASQTITNGIDLAGKGGMVWIKSRSAGTNHFLFDTLRGTTDELNSDTTDAEASLANSLTSFNADGFTVNSATGIGVNAATYASWTFREQAKFFDVVTYTGNGSNRTISHSLGSVPGWILIKRTDTTGDWQVYHRSLANTEYLVLNGTAAKATGTTRWNSTTPTSTEFSLGTDSTVNANSGTYVAYLFAHDAGGFGAAGTDNVISCGSFTYTAGTTINLGYEPQWLLLKRTDEAQDWFLVDVLRGWATDTTSSWVYPNATFSESAPSLLGVAPTATGFTVPSPYGNGGNYIYIAIRRPMKTPTSGTSVFSPVVQNGTVSAGGVAYNFGFPPDAVIEGVMGGAAFSPTSTSRLRGNFNYLITSSTNAEATESGYRTYTQSMLGMTYGLTYNFGTNGGVVGWGFRRAPGFFDEVCYTGNSTNRTIAHNLAAVPELMIVKSRGNVFEWQVYSSGIANTEYLMLNSANAKATGATRWNSTTPTSSVFSLGVSGAVNDTGITYVAYLFASVSGVSKVGSYTGTGTTQVINCGFTAGSRFVMIKRTDSTGDWYVWDTARGIVSGNDPYLLLNSTAAEVTNTDYIDPANSGFEISSTAPAAINANGGTFIFLAIA